MKKIILDTDIGDDIDDAFALALLAACPEADLLGVTTVFRNTAERAQLAERLLAAAGREDVPVYAGERLPEREPIHRFAKDGTCPPEQAHVCQWSEEYAAFPVREGAAEFLAESAARYGKELTVLAIGPLTNVAAAIRRDPAAMAGVRSITIMGGKFSAPDAEWNILCDPEAADTVLRGGAPLYAVGLDVTMQCTLEADLLDRFRTSPKETNRLLTLWLDRWSAYFDFDKSVMHDPLAAASLFLPVCKFEKVYACVDLCCKRGAVCVSPTPRDGYFPVQAATAVDREAFYRFLTERLL